MLFVNFSSIDFREILFTACESVTIRTGAAEARGLSGGGNLRPPADSRIFFKPKGGFCRTTLA